MLESPKLLLCRQMRPPVAAAASAREEDQDCLTIQDPATHAELGVARPLQEKRSWLSWPAARDLEVCESEDRALVFTIRRYWFLTPLWVVDDADGNRVGNVLATANRPSRFERAASAYWMLEDRAKGKLVEAPPAPSTDLPSASGPPLFHGRFVSASETELGTLDCWSGQSVLSFAPALEGDPFTRMLLLAIALLRQS